MTGPAVKRSGQWQPPAAAQACPAVAARWPQFTSRGWVGGRGLEVIFLALHKSPGPQDELTSAPSWEGSREAAVPLYGASCLGLGPQGLEVSGSFVLATLPEGGSALLHHHHYPTLDADRGTSVSMEAAPAFLKPCGPISVPTPRQPWASWGPLMAPNASPPLASVHPPEKQPWRTERISAPHRTRSGRRAGGDF